MVINCDICLLNYLHKWFRNWFIAFRFVIEILPIKICAFSLSLLLRYGMDGSIYRSLLPPCNANPFDWVQITKHLHLWVPVWMYRFSIRPALAVCGRYIRFVACILHDLIIIKTIYPHYRFSNTIIISTSDGIPFKYLDRVYAYPSIYWPFHSKLCGSIYLPRIFVCHWIGADIEVQTR